MTKYTLTIPVKCSTYNKMLRLICDCIGWVGILAFLAVLGILNAVAAQLIFNFDGVCARFPGSGPYSLCFVIAALVLGIDLMILQEILSTFKVELEIGCIKDSDQESHHQLEDDAA